MATTMAMNIDTTKITRTMTITPGIGTIITMRQPTLPITVLMGTITAVHL